MTWPQSSSSTFITRSNLISRGKWAITMRLVRVRSLQYVVNSRNCLSSAARLGFDAVLLRAVCRVTIFFRGIPKLSEWQQWVTLSLLALASGHPLASNERGRREARATDRSFYDPEIAAMTSPRYERHRWAVLRQPAPSASQLTFVAISASAMTTRARPGIQLHHYTFC